MYASPAFSLSPAASRVMARVVSRKAWDVARYPGLIFAESFGIVSMMARAAPLVLMDSSSLPLDLRALALIPSRKA